MEEPLLKPIEPFKWLFKETDFSPDMGRFFRAAASVPKLAREFKLRAKEIKEGPLSDKFNLESGVHELSKIYGICLSLGKWDPKFHVATIVAKDSKPVAMLHAHDGSVSERGVTPYILLMAAWNRCAER